VSQKSPWGFLTFFPKQLGIFLSIFTHLLRFPIYARLQIFIQLSSNVTKLCHIKCDHPANFYISLELELLNLFIEQMTSVLTSCYIRHVCWHYKSVCSLLINFYEWVKYPTTKNCAKDQCPPKSPDLNPLVYHVRCAMVQAFHKLQSKPKTIPQLKSALQQICDDLPQTMINKAIKDFRKRLNACVSADGGHFEHMMWTGWSRLIWHNFVKVADNWIKICSLT